MGGKGCGLNFQEGASHTYTLKLDQSKNSALYKKKIHKKKLGSVWIQLI